MFRRPNTVCPHIVRRADSPQPRPPGLRGPEPHLSRVPNGVVEAVPDGNSLGEHPLLDHAGHRSPAGSHPVFLALGGASINGSRRGHDIHHSMGPGVELGPVVIVHRLPGAHRVGGWHHIGQPAGLGVPLPAKLVAHDAGHTGHAPRAASSVDVVVIPPGVPKISLEVRLSQGQPGIVGGCQGRVALLGGHGLGRLAGRQVQASAIGRFAGEAQVVVGLIDAAGDGKVVSNASRNALAVHFGHGGLHRGPAIVQEGRVALPRHLPIPVNHQHQFGVEVFPGGGIAVGVGVPAGEDVIKPAKIVGAGADGGRPGQSLGGTHNHAVAELLHFLLVDIGPVIGQGPGTVKAHVRGSVKTVDIAFQTGKHVRARVIGGGAVLPRLPYRAPDGVIIKFVK